MIHEEWAAWATYQWAVKFKTQRELGDQLQYSTGAVSSAIQIFLSDKYSWDDIYYQDRRFLAQKYFRNKPSPPTPKLPQQERPWVLQHRVLNKRDYAILKAREDGLSLREVGRQQNLSPERIRQIINRIELTAKVNSRILRIRSPKARILDPDGDDYRGVWFTFTAETNE